MHTDPSIKNTPHKVEFKLIMTYKILKYALLMNELKIKSSLHQILE